MILHSWDASTGAYAGPVTADPSPLEPGVWLWPACSTDVLPPVTGAHEVAVWTGAAWEVRPDFRGETWYRERDPITITDIGDPADAGLTAEPEPEPLAAAKTRLSMLVDAAAETARMAWVTPGTGQAASYIYKAQQAHAVLAVADPQALAPADYPLLASTIGIDGPDLVSVAQVVVTTEAAWVGILAAIEAARKTAKAAVAAAATVAEAEAAAVVAWPTPEPEV